MKALKTPRAWLALVGAGAVLAVIFFALLAAVASPQDNVDNLPVALVNEDAGAKLNGKQVELGEMVVEKVTSSDSPAAGTVEWTRLDSRQEALKGLDQNEYYGAIVIPKNYSGQLAKLLAPQQGGGTTPKPAKIEILTNPAAGQAASGAFQNIASGTVEGVSGAISKRITSVAAERGMQVPPEVAAVIGDPVQAEVTVAEPVGENSADGQMPFFLAFLGGLSGFVGAALIYFATPRTTEGRPSRVGLWSARLVLGLVFAALVAGVETWVSLGLIGAHHDAGAFAVFLFLALAISAVLTVTLLLAATLGTAGIGLSVILNIIIGLVSSGGLLPLEMLPGFYQAYADWLPLRYALDGLRSLLFYEGSIKAGMEEALWVLGAYLGGSVIVGYALTLAGDLAGRRKKEVPPQDLEATGPAQ